MISKKRYFIKYAKEKGIEIMNNLPEDLKKEYEYLTLHNPDIEGIEHPLINISDTLRAYFILAHYFTDPSSHETEKMLVGVRDFNLLGSAIGRQNTSYGGKTKYTDKIEICATLFFGLVKNHSFSDGNKRTALLVLLYQLGLYGYMPIAPKKDFEKLVVSVAANKLPEDFQYEYKRNIKSDDPVVMTIARIIRKLVQRKNHTYHISPTMREFCDAIEKCGVICNLSGGKIHFERKIKKGWLMPPKTLGYTAAFAGWSRTVGADTARSILSNLEIYEEFANYKDFIEGKEPMYQLVDDFSAPLRRLKDR